MFKIGQGSLKLHEYLQSRANVKQSFKFGLRIQHLVVLVDIVEAVHWGWGQLAMLPGYRVAQENPFKP